MFCLGVGDTVKILEPQERGDDWTDEYEKTIGCVGVVTHIDLRVSEFVTVRVPGVLDEGGEDVYYYHPYELDLMYSAENDEYILKESSTVNMDFDKLANIL